MATKKADIKKQEAQDKLISMVEAKLEHCLKMKAGRMEEALTALLAYAGYSIDTIRAYTAKNQQSTALPRWFEDRVVLNVLQPIARTAAAIITSNNPVWLVEPAGDTAEKRQAARGVQAMLDWFYRTNEMPNVLDEVMLRAVLIGYAGVYVDWDSQVGAGDFKDENYGRNGWFMCEPVDIFSWHHEPGVGDESRAHWGIRETTMHIEEARLYFNNPNIEPNKADDDQGDTVRRHLKLVTESEGIDYSEAGETDRVRILQYYQKPGYAFPKGLEIIIAGNQVVEYDEKLLGGEFPVYMMRYMLEPHRDYGAGLGTSLIQLQRDLSLTWNGYRARRDQEIMPPWLVPKGALTRPINTRPKALNEYNARAGAPQPIRMDPLSHVVGGFAETTVGMMEYVSGINDSSRGEAPTSNATGRLTAFLAELDNRRLAPTVRQATRMLQRVGKRMIRLWQEFGSETVILNVIGRGHAAEIAEIRKADLVYNDIDVDVASMMPRTQPLRQETILNLLQMGVITQEQALKSLEFGGFEEAVGIRSTEALNARAENAELSDLMIDPEEIEVLPYEDHDAHLREHIEFVLTNQPAIDIRQRFDQHISQHKAMVQQASAEAQAMAAQAEGGAGPTPGGPPVIEGALAETGGLPSAMVQVEEPGVDKVAEEELASLAGL